MVSNSLCLFDEAELRDHCPNLNWQFLQGTIPCHGSFWRQRVGSVGTSGKGMEENIRGLESQYIPYGKVQATKVIVRCIL